MRRIVRIVAALGLLLLGIAKILFFIAIALFVIFLVLGLLAGKGIKNAVD